MIMSRLIAGVGAVLLTLSIGWAFQEASFSDSFSAITADPWGIVTLVDLYLGFVVFTLIVFLVEPRKSVAAAWCIPLFFLGNIISAVYVIVRGRALLMARQNGDG